MSIRKDNYVRGTIAAGDVYGKVLSVKRDSVVVATPAGCTANLARAGVSKITVAEYKAYASVTAETLDRDAEASYQAGREILPTEKALKSTTVIVERSSGSFILARPGKKGTGKKAEAIAIFHGLVDADGIPSRKDFTAAVAGIGLSAKGASTYFYNLKGGRWSK